MANSNPHPITPQDFPLAVVLTVTTGKLLCTMGEVYEVCEFLAGEPVFTHQLPRVSREAEPVILARYPELRDVEVPEGLDSFEKVNAWLATIAPTYGTSRALEPRTPHAGGSRMSDRAGAGGPSSDLHLPTSNTSPDAEPFISRAGQDGRDQGGDDA